MNQQRVTPTIFLSLYAGLVLLVAGLLGFNEWKTREDTIVQAQDKSRALANLAAEHMLRMVEINDIAFRNAIKYFSLRDVEQSGGIWADWHNLAHLEGSGIAGEVSQVRYMLIIGSRRRRPPAFPSLSRRTAERQGSGLLRSPGRDPQTAHRRPPVRRRTR